MIKIYTKTGDKGETSLFSGKRVRKDDVRIESYGTVDELNSFIGMAMTEVKSPEINKLLSEIQNTLFTCGSDLATPLEYKNGRFTIPRITEEDYKKLENQIDLFSDKLEELRNFILPGGSKGAAILHVCRTVCRKAERLVVTLQANEEINGNIVIFLNRLSDLFFILARSENSFNNVDDLKWNSNS